MKDQCSGEYVGICGDYTYIYGIVVIVMPFTCHSARHMMELQATSARTVALNRGIFRPDDTPYQSKTKNMKKKALEQMAKRNVCLSARHMYSHNPASLVRFNTR